MEKYCKGKHGCGQLKDLREFGTFKRNTKSGLKTYYFPHCRECEKERNKKRQAALKADPELRKKHNAKCRASTLRKKQGIKRTRQTYEERRAKDTKYMRKYMRERRQNDPSFRILHNLRNRLRNALKGKSKSAQTVKLLGISVEGCRQHIEAQFLEGMSWDNYGQWHIDHIVPCDSFNLNDAQQQRLMCHYTNLQPLWGPENIRKGAVITPYVEQRKWTGVQWVNTLAYRNKINSNLHF